MYPRREAHLSQSSSWRQALTQEHLFLAAVFVFVFDVRRMALIIHCLQLQHPRHQDMVFAFMFIFWATLDIQTNGDRESRSRFSFRISFVMCKVKKLHSTRALKWMSSTWKFRPLTENHHMLFFLAVSPYKATVLLIHYMTSIWSGFMILKSYCTMQ